ncbi:techylectin-5A-like [Branchiostoma floridae x Branchiostoma belcheri]
MVLGLVISALVIALVYPYMVSHLQQMLGSRSKDEGTMNTLLQYILTKMEAPESEKTEDMKTAEPALPTLSAPQPAAKPPPPLPRPPTTPLRNGGQQPHHVAKIQHVRPADHKPEPIRSHQPSYKPQQIIKPAKQTRRPCIPPPHDALQTNNTTPRPIRTCPFTTPPPQEHELVDCDDLFKKGWTEKSGVYGLPENRDNQFSSVLSCGVDNNMAWTIIQHHSKSNQAFCRDWKAYRRGFGIAGSNYWLGNEFIHQMTKTKCYKLQILMEDSDGITRRADYDYFALDGESDNYTLWLGEYRGNAGDVMGEYSGKSFQTKDRIAGNNSSTGLDLCPGGWWSDWLSLLHLNGIQQYHNMGEVCDKITWWKTWKAAWKSQYGYNASFPFRFIEMRILPVRPRKKIVVFPFSPPTLAKTRRP